MTTMNNIAAVAVVSFAALSLLNETCAFGRTLAGGYVIESACQFPKGESCEVITSVEEEVNDKHIQVIETVAGGARNITRLVWEDSSIRISYISSDGYWFEEETVRILSASEIEEAKALLKKGWMPSAVLEHLGW